MTLETSSAAALNPAVVSCTDEELMAQDAERGTMDGRPTVADLEASYAEVIGRQLTAAERSMFHAGAMSMLSAMQQSVNEIVDTLRSDWLAATELPADESERQP